MTNERTATRSSSGIPTSPNIFLTRSVCTETKGKPAVQRRLVQPIP
jgi:hypothetical protein